MSASPDNFYARWRARAAAGPALREQHDPFPAEHLLQAVWLQQRLLREQLTTLDGQTVRVLHPGFKNHSAGPDFQNAIVQIGGESPRNGDIEIDLKPGGWRAHGHDRNPNFRHVVLHVIWEGDRPGAEGIPTMALQGRLDAPLADLSASLGRDSLRALPESLRGRCCAPVRDLAPGQLTQLLHEAALVRWRNKTALFQARARQAGWDQALWEGLLRALGYKHNVWPMQSLAELRPGWRPVPRSALECQARLLGLSGLLPADLNRKPGGSDKYIREVWDQWWRERDPLAGAVLPRRLWRLNGLRPANHPQRRLALAAHWLASGDLAGRLEKWFTAKLPDKGLPDSLLNILDVGEDPFWSWHWTFRSARLARPQPLLGAARVTDLAVNVILPWLWTRAAEGANEELQRVAEQRYFAWPSAEDNSLLRLARQRLLGGAAPGALRGAAAQQGLLQILRDYCDHSNALCEQCQFPDLVHNFRRSASPTP